MANHCLSEAVTRETAPVKEKGLTDTVGQAFNAPSYEARLSA